MFLKFGSSIEIKFVILPCKRENSDNICEVMSMIYRLIVIILGYIFIPKIQVVYLKFI
jgi:hypothetical protein